MLDADAFEYVCHGVAYGWGGGEAEVYDAEGDGEAAACLLGHELADACYLEGGALDGLAEDFEVG